jgi:DNA mismatch endonuclease (patch repair protein)
MDYWNQKLDRNIERDREHSKQLRLLGWRRIVVWECETLNSTRLAMRLRTLLRPRAAKTPSSSSTVLV